MTLEIHVNFKDVIALRICNQPFYKMITYTEQVSTLEHLKAQLSLEDFAHHPEKLTEKNIKDETVFTYNHEVMQIGDFTKIVRRNQST